MAELKCKSCKAACAHVGHPETNLHEKCLVGYLPITNADRIRAMSDEELARLHSTATACHRCEVPGCDGGHLNCYDIWLDWLKQEVD